MNTHCSWTLTFPHTSPTTGGGGRCSKPCQGGAVLLSTVHAEYCPGVQGASTKRDDRTGLSWVQNPSHSGDRPGGHIVFPDTDRLHQRIPRKDSAASHCLAISYAQTLQRKDGLVLCSSDTSVGCCCLPTAALATSCLYAAPVTHPYLLYFGFIPSITLSSHAPCN